MTIVSIINDDISLIIPLIYAYKNKTKKHILLCENNPQKHQLAKKLKDGIKTFAKTKNFSWEVKIITTDKENFNLSKQINLTKDTILNISDSSPILTLLSTQCILDNGGKVISYDYQDNSIYTLNPDDSTTHQKLTPTMDIESFMMLQNFTIKSKKTAKDIQNRKEQIYKLYKEEHLYRKVKNLLLYEDENFDTKKYKQTLEAFKKLGIVDDSYKLIPSKQKELQGDLLEEYLFWLCEELNPDDIAVAVLIDFDSDNCKISQNKIHNEFDILILNNNQLSIIECKYKRNLKGQEIIYKYDSIIDYFGNNTKAIIANISTNQKEPYLNTKTSKNFQHSSIRRAKAVNIELYHESKVDKKKFQELVGGFFGIGR